MQGEPFVQPRAPLAARRVLGTGLRGVLERKLEPHQSVPENRRRRIDVQRDIEAAARRLDLSAAANAAGPSIRDNHAHRSFRRLARPGLIGNRQFDSGCSSEAPLAPPVWVRACPVSRRDRRLLRVDRAHRAEHDRGGQGGCYRVSHHAFSSKAAYRGDGGDGRGVSGAISMRSIVIGSMSIGAVETGTSSSLEMRIGSIGGSGSTGGRRVCGHQFGRVDRCRPNRPVLEGRCYARAFRVVLHW